MPNVSPELALLEAKLEKTVRQSMPAEFADRFFPKPFTPPREVNALKATGPRTAEGKAASSRNAVKHGLTARQALITGESQADFDALLESVAADRKPVGELEIQFTGEIAACLWRLARARKRESDLLERFDFFTTPGGREIDRLIRYTSSIERQLNRASVRLYQLQAERRKLESAAPAPAPEPAAAPEKAMAAAAGSPAPPSAGEFVSQTVPRAATQSATVAPRAANSRGN
ncbi:MAG: hypothetical protein JSU00_21540 [Acidobacteria bacterium]|nr:hypothetical protein [Acidobacteriota bacterium]